MATPHGNIPSPVRVAFFGTPSFAAHILQSLLRNPALTVTLVVTQPDRPMGRGNVLTPPPVKECASAHSIPVLQPVNLRRNEAECRASLTAHAPFDIGIVVAFGQILPSYVLTLPSHGCLNVHASLLPRWRGAAPIQRAIMAGDSETGVCLMAMDEGLDTGAVYASRALPIGPDECAGELHDRLMMLGADLLNKEIEAIVRGDRIARPQSVEGVNYAAKITNAEAQIDWSLPAAKIHNIIRGLSPTPGAFSFLNGQRLKIFRSLRCCEHSRERAGTLLALTKPAVVCGDGELIELCDVQLEGRKRVAGTSFLHGVLPRNEGAVLGPRSR